MNALNLRLNSTMSKRRVKLYALNAERQWDDRGTGHVTASYIERLKGMSLLVRAETDGSLLLESKIMPDTVYQKQQGTLIVWSELENFDLALSFQEKAGCDEIWERICQVQGKDPSLEVTHDIEESEDERYEDVNETNLWIELPQCELSKLEGINEVLSNSLQSPVKRERVATAIENEGYIKKLITLFNMCEDLDNMDGLHLLYDIFKNIFLLNKNALFEIMFADDTIFDVVGALEYDPNAQYPKPHRQFLKNRVKFKEVIPIENSDLLSKIHQTYRVQYIQDVVLPPPAVFEENMLSTLSSFVFFNKVEIVSLIQEDERFLTELFHQLSASEDEIPIDKRRDLVLFLKEFCTFSQTLQPINRETFFKTLSSMGVLYALEITLSIEDQVIKSASVDILSYIVEFSPSLVREYMMQQQHKVEEEQYLLNIIIEQMVLDGDPEMGGAVQLMGILRLLIDPENMMTTATKSERTDFLVFFYKHSMHALVAPLLSNTVGNKVGREDYQTAQLLALILELLSFCVEHHTYHIKNYIVQRDLLNRILVLMQSKHTFLVLCALRFMRKIVGLKDDFYNRHIVSLNLFAPVVDAFVRNNGRYNLLDSATIEMFEYIKTEDISMLSMNIVEKFDDVLSKVEYVKTFQGLKLKYDQHQDNSLNKDKLNSSIESLGDVVRATSMGGLGSPGSGRFRRDAREMEAEEEIWFNNDEDDEPDPEPVQDRQISDRESSTSPPPPNCSNLDSLRPTSPTNCGTSPTSPNSYSPAYVTSPSALNKKISLVDYDSDEEDEEAEEEGVEEEDNSNNGDIEEEDRTTEDDKTRSSHPETTTSVAALQASPSLLLKPDNNPFSGFGPQELDSDSDQCSSQSAAKRPRLSCDDD